MPSMPIYFWNDPDGRRYRESYFEMFPGVWRQGDWVTRTSRGTFVVRWDSATRTKVIRDEFGKTVKPTIQGDELRVSSKSRDDLQAVQRMLKGADLDVALQFTNYR